MAWNIAKGNSNRLLIYEEWTRVGAISLNDLQHGILEYGACHVDAVVELREERGPAMTMDPVVTLKIEDSIEFSGSTHSWVPAALPEDKRAFDVYARCGAGKTAFVTASLTLTFLSDCIVNEYQGGMTVSFLALEIQRLDQALAKARVRLDALESA